jgi:hypothetical protein
VLHGDEHAAEVDRDQAIPFVVGDLVRRLDRLLDACVVEGDVEAAEALDRSVKAARMSSARVTSQVTASAWPPACSIIRAVSRLPSAATSATTTFAPSRAKASAVARPMPVVAPVTKATLSSKRLMGATAP